MHGLRVRGQQGSDALHQEKRHSELCGVQTAIPADPERAAPLALPAHPAQGHQAGQPAANSPEPDQNRGLWDRHQNGPAAEVVRVHRHSRLPRARDHPEARLQRVQDRHLVPGSGLVHHTHGQPSVPGRHDRGDVQVDHGGQSQLRCERIGQRICGGVEGDVGQGRGK